IGKLAASASSDIGDYRPAVRPHSRALPGTARAHSLVGLGRWHHGRGLHYVHAAGRGAAWRGVLGLTVTAAIVTSLMLDHFGLVGLPRHPPGACRILGAALMMSGLGLIATF